MNAVRVLVYAIAIIGIVFFVGSGVYLAFAPDGEVEVHVDDLPNGWQVRCYESGRNLSCVVIEKGD
jgi:hypothetical protein